MYSLIFVNLPWRPRLVRVNTLTLCSTTLRTDLNLNCRINNWLISLLSYIFFGLLMTSYTKCRKGISSNCPFKELTPIYTKLVLTFVTPELNSGNSNTKIPKYSILINWLNTKMTVKSVPPRNAINSYNKIMININKYRLLRPAGPGTQQKNKAVSCPDAQL